jgi:hypothetical protein
MRKNKIEKLRKIVVLQKSGRENERNMMLTDKEDVLFFLLILFYFLSNPISVYTVIPVYTD